MAHTSTAQKFNSTYELAAQMLEFDLNKSLHFTVPILINYMNIKYLNLRTHPEK